VDQSGPVAHAPAEPNACPWPFGKLETAFVLPLLSAYLFLAGWLYHQTFYGTLGLDHKSLGLPFHVYLITPWFVYVTAALFVPSWMFGRELGPSLAGRFTPRIQSDGASHAGLKKAIIAGDILFVLLSAGLSCATWWALTKIILFDENSRRESITGGIALFLYVGVFPHIYKDRVKGTLAALRRFNGLVFLFFGLLVLGFVVDTARNFAVAESLSADRRLPEVALIWNDQVPDGRPDPISKDKFTLRLLHASSSELYVFSPRSDVTERMPRIFCIPRDKLRYYIQR